MDDDLPPEWYEPEAKPKKHKASVTLTKDLEKKKNVASIVVDEEDKMLRATIPTRR